MLIGYARTSTTDQAVSLEVQVEALGALGCEKVFHEQTSARENAGRPELEAALDYTRDGDTLVVMKLDRLARSVRDLIDIAYQLKDKGAGLKIADLDIDTSTANGKLVLNIFGAVAEFERELMLERQREGIARARADGKYRGRKPTARAKAPEVLALRQQGVGATEIANRVGIGRASVYRIIRDQETT